MTSTGAAPQAEAASRKPSVRKCDVGPGVPHDLHHSEEQLLPSSRKWFQSRARRYAKTSTSRERLRGRSDAQRLPLTSARADISVRTFPTTACNCPASSRMETDSRMEPEGVPSRQRLETHVGLTVGNGHHGAIDVRMRGPKADVIDRAHDIADLQEIAFRQRAVEDERHPADDVLESSVRLAPRRSRRRWYRERGRWIDVEVAEQDQHWRRSARYRRGAVRAAGERRRRPRGRRAGAESAVRRRR
jgi:hypothetical protein